jgi:hypothetical protein
MLRPVKVFGCVLVFRRIATTHMAADHAQTQMNPGVADFQAVLTSACMRFDVSNLIDVRAFVHSISYQSQLFQICLTGSRTVALSWIAAGDCQQAPLNNTFVEAELE